MMTFSKNCKKNQTIHKVCDCNEKYLNFRKFESKKIEVLLKKDKLKLLK